MDIFLSLLNYSKGILVHPNKTLKAIKEDKNLKTYSLSLIPIILVIGVVQGLLFPLIGLSREQNILISLFYTPISLGFVYIIARIFKKKGSFLALFVTNYLIIIIYFPIAILVSLYLGKVNWVVDVSITLASLWALYLAVLTINVVYGLSKKKATVITILYIVIGAILVRFF